MNPYDLMESKKEMFTKNDQIIYEYVKDHSYEIFRSSIVEFAKQVGVSQPSISRFCKKLGYESYTEFKMQLYRTEKIGAPEIIESHMNFSILEAYKNIIDKIDFDLSPTTLLSFASSIMTAEKVIVTGVHKSKLPAELLKYNLYKFGITCIYLDSDDSFEVSNIVTPNDLVILFSAQAENKKELVKELRSLHIPLALITMNSKVINKDKYDYYIWLPNYKNQNEKVYTENMVIFSIFVDLLTSFIANVYNEKK